MSEKFNIEIITPTKSILKTETPEVTIPSYEGQMGILANHIPLITFLRPGLIVIKNQEEIKYYVEEGTVEFSNNNLLILTSTAINIKNFNKTKIDELITVSQKKLQENNFTDKEKYILSYKIDTLRDINQ